MTVNTAIAVAEIASKTAIWLAGIGAALKIALAAVPQLRMTKPPEQPEGEKS